MKKLSLMLAVLLALALLCSCAKSIPVAPPVQPEQTPAEPETAEPANVYVTTFTAKILTTGNKYLMVEPIEASTAGMLAVELADGLVPVGADGWPISVSELAETQLVDITYLGDVISGDPEKVLAVALRVVPTEQEDEPLPEQTEPAPVETVRIPFTTVELPEQAPVDAQIPYDGLTLYGFPCIRTEIVRDGEADLDGCGTAERIQLLRIWDQYDQQSFVLRIQRGDEILLDTCIVEEDTTYPVSFNAHIWLADLDDDGYPEVYFNGNMNRDQYVLNVWSMKSGTLELLAFEDQIYLDALILSIDESALQLESTQEVLGSYTAVRAYALSNDTFQPLSDAWQIVPANTSYSRMTLVRELPVTLDDGSEGTFASGSIVQVTGTDGKSFVDLITDDGITGRVAVEQPAGSWQWYIDGEPELSYFTLVPYAG